MKYIFPLIFLLFGFSLSAQIMSRDTLPNLDSLLTYKPNPYVKADVQFGVLANKISTNKIFNFISTDFLEDQDKADLLSDIHHSLRYGYFREISFSYHQPGYQVLDIYKRGQGFGIANKYFNSGRLSKDLLNIMFYGNKPYAGQMLELGPSSYETWYYTNLDYYFDVELDTVPINMTVSIALGHDHLHYNARKADLYTDPDGAYLNTDLNYKLREKLGDAAPLEGLGVTIGAHTTYRFNKKWSADFSVEDFGIMRWNNGLVLDVDSTFKFRGFNFDNVFDINDSVRHRVEDNYRSTFLYKRKGGYVALTPFYAQLLIAKKTGKKGIPTIFAGLDYRLLAGYLPKLSAGAIFKTGRQQRLTTSLSVGGFNMVSLNAAYALKLFRHWKLQLNIQNLDGLLVPVLPGGAVGYVGLQWEL